jgi:hypothetical protein
MAKRVNEVMAVVPDIIFLWNHPFNGARSPDELMSTLKGPKKPSGPAWEA